MQKTAAYSIIFITGIFSLVSISYYLSNKEKYYTMTLTQPFSDWQNVRDAFYSLEGKNKTAANISNLLDTAWCLRPPIRPYTTPQNRSKSCDCLFQKVEKIFNNSRPTFDDSVKRYGSEVMGCLAYRSVWNIWPCTGGLCRVNPLLVSYVINYIFFLIAVGYVVGMSMGNEFYNAGMIVTFLAVFGCFPLLIADFTNNILYAVPFLILIFVFIFSIQDEVKMYGNVETTHPLFAPAEPLMVCFWIGYTLTTPVVVINAFSSNLMRDIMGIITLGMLGYFAGVLGQRMFWVKWYVKENMCVEGKLLDVRASKTFGNLMWYALLISQMCVWIGLFVVFFFLSLYAGPLSSCVFSGVCLGFYVVVFILESFNFGRSALQFGIIEMAQLIIVVGVNACIAIVSLMDFNV